MTVNSQNVRNTCDPSMTENSLHLSAETLDLVTRQMAVAVTRCSRDFRYLWANQKYADWLRRPLENIVGHKIIDVLGTEAFEALLPWFKQVLAGEIASYEEQINVSGIGKRWLSATYTPTFDGGGSVDGWVAVVLDITEKKREEDARFRHAAIVESSEDAIICKDLNAIITSWNMAAQRIFGYTEAEVVGQPITILIPPELLDEENTILEKLRAGGRIEHYETTRLKKSGERVDVSLVIGPINNSSGRVVGFSKIARDITPRKRAELALRESEERFRLVADTAPVLIWMSGVDKLCTYFNKPWLDFTGRSLEQELGNGWAEGVHPDDLPNCLNTYAQSFDLREKFEMHYRLRRHDGEYRWILDLGVPRLNSDGSFAGYIGSLIDVTEHKMAEEALRALNQSLKTQVAVTRSREELLKIFVKNVPAGVAMLDRDMRYLQVSDRWCQDYSVTSCQLLGNSHYELFPDIPPQWKEMHGRALRGEVLRADEDRWDREDGSTVWTRWEIRPWKTSAGDIGGILIFAENITRRKQMEEALSGLSRKLIESQEQERARVARELHDDVSQQLALLAVELDQWHNSIGPDPDLNAQLDHAKQRIAGIARDVQSLSHQLHSSKLEYLGLVAAAKSFCKEVSEMNNMQIDFTEHGVSRTLPNEISLSLFRILQQAVHNAIEHSGVRRIEVRLWEQSHEVHLQVKDLGKGFDLLAEMQGAGLGLTSMRERARLVNGNISIDSKPMQGTTIRVRVPLNSAPRMEKRAV
jgi:PAS domain S-box-containing protein